MYLKNYLENRIGCWWGNGRRLDLKHLGLSDRFRPRRLASETELETHAQSSLAQERFFASLPRLQASHYIRRP
jgi:hypothetical protein